MFDTASVAQRVDYASVVGSAPRDQRPRWESRFDGWARESLKTAIAAWCGARRLSRDAFRSRLLDPGTSNEVIDRLQEAAKGIVEAQSHEQLGDAGAALATAAFRVGLDA